MKLRYIVWKKLEEFMVSGLVSSIHKTNEGGNKYENSSK